MVTGGIRTREGLPATFAGISVACTTTRPAGVRLMQFSRACRIRPLCHGHRNHMRAYPVREGLGFCLWP